MFDASLPDPSFLPGQRAVHSAEKLHVLSEFYLTCIQGYSIVSL